MCSAVSESDTCVDGAASEEQVAAVRAQLEGDALSPLISSMTFDTKEETYAKLVEQVGEEQASVLSPDQAFEVFFVTMKDPGQSQVLAEAFSGQAGTPFVLEGVFAALLGSALASAAVVAGMHFGVNGYLRGRVPFITTWVTMQDAALVVPVLVGIGVVLAALSAGFAIRRWLRT
ncbi:unnamed protein product [Penicillium discolor]